MFDLEEAEQRIATDTRNTSSSYFRVHEVISDFGASKVLFRFYVAFSNRMRSVSYGGRCWYPAHLLGSFENVLQHHQNYQKRPTTP